MLEANIENLRSEIIEYQEAVRTASANIDGTIARWKVEFLKNEISESKASRLFEAAEAFVVRITKDIAISRASKALQMEINRKVPRSEYMDDRQTQRQATSKSPLEKAKPRSSSKNVRGKGSPHVK